jgi:DNA-binding XRE family transcriptional regulator
MSTQGQPEPPPHAALAEAIGNLRREADLTQEELAERADLHPTWISHLESGRVNPAWETVERIGWALEIPLRDLAALAERPRPEAEAEQRA